MLQANYTLVDTEFPAGTVAAGISVSIIDAATGAVMGAQNVAAGEVPAPFDITAPGTYFARIVRVDVNGASLGATGDSEHLVISAPATVIVQTVGTVTLSAN